MRLSLSDDQALLLETTRRLLDDHNPMTRVRELVDDPLGYDPAVWAKGADLGWFSMLIPEQFGGGSISGDGLIDLAIVAEALGAGLYGGPFLPTNVVAAAIAEMGTREQCDRYLPGIAAGERTATWAVAEVDRDWSAKPDTLRAVARGNDLVLNGSKTWVAHAASADVLLVVAAADDGPVYLLVEREAPGVTVEPLKALDLTNRFAEVRFEDVAVSSDAVLDPHKDNVNTDRILQVALCLVCADSNGVTDRGLDITVQYSKDRIAFGRPIGSYQALKHRMANYRVQLEGSWAATAYAAESVSRGLPDAAIAARVAKAHVGKWSSVTLQDCIQMHGGIGVTWDYDLHFYTRRAISNEMLYGSPYEQHRQLVHIAEKVIA